SFFESIKTASELFSKTDLELMHVKTQQLLVRFEVLKGIVNVGLSVSNDFVSISLKAKTSYLTSKYYLVRVEYPNSIHDGMELVVRANDYATVESEMRSDMSILLNCSSSDIIISNLSRKKVEGKPNLSIELLMIYDHKSSKYIYSSKQECNMMHSNFFLLKDNADQSTNAEKPYSIHIVSIQYAFPFVSKIMMVTQITKNNIKKMDAISLMIEGCINDLTIMIEAEDLESLYLMMTETLLYTNTASNPFLIGIKTVMSPDIKSNEKLFLISKLLKILKILDDVINLFVKAPSNEQARMKIVKAAVLELQIKLQETIKFIDTESK
ncbi:MAG: hypothetical protein MHPSP_001130, partial [Paramarteilia canceri]